MSYHAKRALSYALDALVFGGIAYWLALPFLDFLRSIVFY